jgi:catechol 2,3-dioxygenase-like lactoylglutathione lyase family enzyme
VIECKEANMSSVHVSLRVSDLAESVRFYRGLFGEPRKLEPDYAKFVGEEPEIHLALQPGLAGKASAGSLSHLGIRVASREEVRQWRSDLRGRGILSEEERLETCCYAVQDKFWLSDPDGNRWEVYTVLEDVEPTPARAVTPCCSD